jgi:hypothetical protein
VSISEIVTRLKDPKFAESTRLHLSEYQDANPQDVERVTKWISALRDDLVALINEINDEDEVKMTLAINYIEIKSRWIALNTKIAYQNFRLGKCDPVTALRGCATSSLLVLVEGLLTQGDIDQIAEFLAEPIRRAA